MNSHIHVTTEFNADSITTTTAWGDAAGPSDPMHVIMWQVVQLQEESVRKALIAQGWTPPPAVRAADTPHGPEHLLRAQLVDMNREHQARIQPLLDALVRHEAMRAPRPFYIEVDEFNWASVASVATPRFGTFSLGTPPPVAPGCQHEWVTPPIGPSPEPQATCRHCGVTRDPRSLTRVSTGPALAPRGRHNWVAGRCLNCGMPRGERELNDCPVSPRHL